MQDSRHALSLHHKIYPHLPNPVAIVLMVAPILLKLGKSSPVVLWLSVVTRGTALLLPASGPTRGLVRVIRYWLHLWVDRALVWSHHCPSAFHFTGLDAGTTGFSPL